MPHAWAEIDLDAIRRNLRTLKSRQPHWAEMIAMVKANAYGHGAIEVARAVIDAGAARLGVAFVAEGKQLRAGGIQAPILVAGSSGELEIDDLFEHDLVPTVWDLELPRAIDERARRHRRRMRVHVEVDTGMSRLGVGVDEAVALIQNLQRLPGVIVEGLSTHFATADEADGAYAAVQQRRFHRVLARLAADGIRIPVIHTQNSAALLRLEETGITATRPGIALYGLDPGGAAPPEPLIPAMTLRSRVVLVKRVAAGTFVSYGRTYKAPSDRFLATISIGYADGYPRHLSNRGEVLIRGKRHPIVGRVTMDHTVVDLGNDSSIRTGDVVTLIGRDASQAITAAQLAGWADTIHYEIVTSVSQRVPRLYRGVRAAAAGRTAPQPEGPLR